MKIGVIYTIEDPKSGEIRYIGRTFIKPGYRLDNHCSEKDGTKRSNWIQSIIKKGARPVIKVLEECDETNYIEREIYWISQFKTWGFNLVNSTIGGDGIIGVPITEKQRKERSERGKLYVGKNNPFYGKTHSKETKEKISEAGKGRKMPQSHIDSCKKRMVDKNHAFYSEETKRKRRENQVKKVVQLSLTGEYIATYETIRMAMSNLCISQKTGHITTVCKGRRLNCAGYNWMYESEYMDAYKRRERIEQLNKH